jgi:predicted transcriptional regulator
MGAEQQPYQEYVIKPRRARARLLTDSEVIKCYNGYRIGQKGDYVVIDEEDRVMIVKSHKFEKNFTEAK